MLRMFRHLRAKLMGSGSPPPVGATRVTATGDTRVTATGDTRVIA